MSDTMTTVVTEPGIYADMPDTVYHGDPVPAGSLSVSGAKKLLPPYCPAIYRHERDNGRAPKKAFDFGHAAHLEVLGEGPEIVVCDYDAWRTNEAKAAKKAAYDAGKVPLLPPEYAVVKAMGEAIRRHPLAMTLLSNTGAVEQSAFWVDPDFGVWRRARFDRWTQLVSGRVAIVDYKTSDSADPYTFRRTAANFAYHCQDAWYRDAAKAVGLDDDPAFVFIVQDKNPPYLVTVVQLDDDARATGAERNRRALEIFRDCQQSGIWPGYTDEIATVALPKWATYQHEETFND